MACMTNILYQLCNGGPGDGGGCGGGGSSAIFMTPRVETQFNWLAEVVLLFHDGEVFFKNHNCIDLKSIRLHRFHLPDQNDAVLHQEVNLGKRPR